MDIKKLSNKDIENLDYSKLVGFLKERNKPSGGLKSIVEVCKVCNFESGSKFLEIGSNTGFTSVNLALLNKNSQVFGVDINENSIIEAENFAKLNLVSDRVSFKLQNSEKLGFKDGEFDLVWSSNVTSFIQNKEKAIGEYLRVLDYGGYLILIPIYYLEKPTDELLDKVSKAINSKVEYKTKKDWIDLFNLVSDKFEKINLELIYEKDYKYLNQNDKRIKEYCMEVLNKSGLSNLNLVNNKLFEKYTEYMKLFNKNLQKCGYSIIIFQKRNLKDESELFLSEEV